MDSLLDRLRHMTGKKCFLCSRVRPLPRRDDNDHHLCDRCFERLIYLGQLETIIASENDIVQITWKPKFSKDLLE